MDSQEPPPLDELEKKISVMQRQRESAAGRRERRDNGFGMALRIGAEFASGVLVGGGFGWMLDKWLNTTPWLFIVCFMLGACAGGLTVYRTIVRIEKSASDNSDRQEHKTNR